MRARKHRNGSWSWMLFALTLALSAMPVVQGTAASKAVPVPHRVKVALTTPGVWLQVSSARDSFAYSAGNPTAAQKGDSIPYIAENGKPAKPNAPKDYKWLINLDNTGNTQGGADSALCHPSTNPSYPTGCSWPSVRYATASPALSEGTYNDWSLTTSLPAYGLDPVSGVATGLPDTCDATSGNPVPHTALGTAVPGTVACRFLVSVSADGYQMGGAHFSVSFPATPVLVSVGLNPFPIPLGTMRLRVFNDSHPTDGQFDNLTEKGLAGFLGLVYDVDGILQADYYGNQLCTTYKTDAAGKIIVDSYGKPTPLPAKEPAAPDANGYYNPTVPGRCLSDTNGDIVIPNLAPNHYSAKVTPPDFNPNAPDIAKGVASSAPFHWLQTTTLEGNHDHDVWVMPNDTGLDTELVVGGESVPFVDFGFVAATPVPAAWATGCPAGGIAGQTSGCGQIKGQLYGATAYSPGVNGIAQVPLAGSAGLKLDKPIDRGWVSLNNLNTSTGDTEAMVATVPTDAQGNFTFSNVPDGDYQVTVFDEPQDYIMDMVVVTITHGQLPDMGILPLNAWFTHVSGHVFIDLNGNGRQDPGEPGVFHAFVQNLNRTNNTMVGGIPNAYTDNNGFYNFTEAYPLGLMSINQFFNTRYKTTGITYQACNDPKEHTVVAPMVDVSYLPLISQCGRLDWGVTPYNPMANGDNGGIVATMFYDQSRQKYNARQAQTLDIQTGIPGFRFEQYTPIKAAPGTPAFDPTTGAPLMDPMSGYALNPDGSYQTVQPLTTPDGTNCASPTAAGSLLCYVSENNAPPARCYPRDANGTPQGYDPNNPKSFDFVMFGGACIEAPASGLQFGLGTDNAGAPLGHPVQTVDGNYTLGNGNTMPAMNLGDTLVRAVVPVDHVLQGGPNGICPIIINNSNPILGCDAAQVGLPRKLYSYTSELDVNLFTGPQYVPQGANTASLPWPPKVHYFAGTATAVNGTTLTDASLAGTPQAWTTDAFVGDQVKVGTSTAMVTGNTDTTLTFDHWTGGTPAPGAFTVRSAEIIPGNYDENQFTYAPGIDAICSGVTSTVKITNPDLLANGGSPFEGQTRHSCDMKLLNVQAGQSIAPNFHVRTAVDIPLPTHFVGLIVDDVSVQNNRKSTYLGEVAGIPGVPIGLYDWAGNNVGKATSDYNGIYEILMPAEAVNNCPVPAGTCPNVFRFVGNDPGQPGAPNLNYDPNYRTISSNFESWANMLVPADNAPSRVVTNVMAPGLGFTATSPCGIKDLVPQVFSVGPNPYTYANDTPEPITITGANFGTTGHVEFAPLGGNTPVRLRLAPGTSWTNNKVTVLIGANEVGDTGPGTLTVFNDGAIDATTGKTPRSTSGLTFHVLGGGYNPHLITVGPGKDIDPFALNPDGTFVHPNPVQEALDRAATAWQTYGVAHVNATHTVSQVANDPNERYLVVVYPHWSANPDLNQPFVPLGTYYENLIVHSPLELQGVGPGGNYVDPTGATVSVQGSIVDGRYFTATTATTGVGIAPNPATDSTEPAILAWTNLLASIQGQANGTGLVPVTATNPAWTGQQSPLGEGAVITVVGTKGTYPSGFKAGVDGFTISGGDQSDFPGNITQMGGGVVRETGAGLPGQPVGAVNTQGGAVYLNGGTDNFRLTNNLVRQNSGSYGAIRLGTPLHGSALADGGSSHNYNTAISHNQIVFNGGTNLAGAVGIFSDSNNYSVDHNTFCMNVALEYGGAVSHFGFSPNGSISNNEMLLNSTVDEGGAIMVASEPAYTIVGGEQVADPAGMTEGSGAVSIDHNYIGLNIAQDDGGGIRLMGTTGKGDVNHRNGLSPITITNNMLTNNISAHEGGAVSMNDAPVVNIVNNTIAGNLTTASGTTSNGQPAPAGVASGSNSAGLMALLNGQYRGQSPDWMLTGSTAGPDPHKAWPTYSSPLIENDIFWDNRAGSWATSGISQLGLPGDISAINRWDVGSVDGGAGLRVRNTLIYTSPTAPSQTWLNDGNNKIFGIQTPQTDPVPGFLGAYNACHNDPPLPSETGCVNLQIQQQRTYFRFRPAAIVSVDLPANALGDYHLLNIGSPAHAMGANPQDLAEPLIDDIDGNARPSSGGAVAHLVTAGAHEVTALPTGAAGTAGPPPAGPSTQRGTPPLGLPGGSSTPAATVGATVKATVRQAPVGHANSHGGGNGGAPISGAPATAAALGAGTLLAGILAFEQVPEHQGQSGLAALVALSLILAAFQVGRVALRRRRKTVLVHSDEQNIEGGEQL